MFKISLCFALIILTTLQNSHFTALTNTTTASLVSFPLVYNTIRSVYQINIGIQNTSSSNNSIEIYPMDLNTTTPYFSFVQNNISINSTGTILYNLNVYFSNTTILSNQTILFEIDKNIYEEFTPMTFQGIIGLGLTQTQDNNSLLTCISLLSELKSQNFINYNMFSVYLGSFPFKSNESIITFGGYNTSLISNDILYYIDSISNNSWSFKLMTIELLYIEETLLKGTSFAGIAVDLDISTPNIKFTFELLEEYISLCNYVYKTCRLLQENSLYCIDQYSFISKDLPFIVIFFSKDLYLVIDPDTLSYNCGKTEEQLSYCFLHLGLSISNETVVLGQVFLKNTYILFNMENNSIGISFERYLLQSSVINETLNYTFYALLMIWGFSMVACGAYFKVHLLRLNIMANRISKVFYERVRNAVRGNQNEMDLDDSEEEDEEEDNPNNLINPAVN